MSPRCLLLLLVTCAVTISSARAQSPQLIAPTDPLAPQEQRATFHLPTGFEIQLIVSEAHIGQPMNLNFDAAGRLWITSSITYPYPTVGEGVQPRPEKFGPASPPPSRDWVTVVEDIGPEGTPGKVTRFTEGLNIPIGLLPLHDSTLTFDIPSIKRHRDTDGDGRSDESTPLITGFGNVDTHGMTNGFTRWVDGWVYACHGFANESQLQGTDGRTLTLKSGNTYRFRPDGSGIEQFTWGQVNPYGLTFDPLGNLYSADCHSLPLTLLLRGAYYSSFGKPHDGLGFGPDMINHLHGSTGICGPAYYAADHFPPEYQDCLYLCNPVTGRVHRDRLVDHGSTRLVDSQPDFITCDDPWFRPVDVQMGPDGCLYIADFYNAIIGHYEVELPHPRRDRTHGRVWRVVYRGDGSVEPPPMINLTQLPIEDLVERLGDANLIVRTLATHELVDRFGPDAAEPVIQVFEATSSPEQHVHAMWVLERLGSLHDELLLNLSLEASRLIRTHVARLIAERDDWPDRALLVAALERLAGDEDAFVRRAAVDALGRQPRQSTVPLLLGLLDETPEDDTHLRHTIRIALRNQFRSGRIDLNSLAATLSDGQAADLASVMLAIESEDAGTFLAGIIDRLETPPQIVQEYVRHIARVGTEKALEQALNAGMRRFDRDLSARQQLLLAAQDGLNRRGAQPGESIREQASTLARRLLTQDSPEFHWHELTLNGTRINKPVWSVQRRGCQDGQEADFFSSLPSGEDQTGVLRSSVFELPQRLRFFLAGHCGFPEQPCHGKNRVRLVEAATGVVLAEVVAPRNDTAQPIEWDLAHPSGRQAYMELIDGDRDDAYAWLAAGRFSLDTLAPVSFNPYQAAVDLVREFALTDLQPTLESLLNEESTGLTARTAAAESLLALHPDARLSSLLQVAFDPLLGAGFAAEVFAVVQHPDADRIDKALAVAMQALPAARQQALAAALAQDAIGVESLLRLIEAGRASRRLLLDEKLKQQLLASRVEDVDQRLNALTAGLPSVDDQIVQRINERRQSFSPESTSIERGRVVFEKTCAACHRIGDKGALIGPQLDGVGIRGLDRLLEDILDPNRNVDAAFRTSTILTTEGKVLIGLFRREEGAALVFADQKGQEFTVNSADIDERIDSPVSLMPANVHDLHTPTEIDDLLAYLLTQRTPVQKSVE